ncbi:hypothetical protein N8198_06150 [Gammaproteobacteria bacterium]|nr:hypothetical protein [Gammaproteobacteria bacterium]
MPKHVLFLVHGMGDTVPGWSIPVQKLIKQKYQLYKISGIKKFDNNFVFKELNYNHVFEGHIEKWKENASAVTNILEASGIENDLLSTLMGFSSKAARKEFAGTHLLDVVLYRFMKGIKSQVISHISEQLVGKLNESSTVPAYSIICHSLGTAVMHDVMQANLTTDHFPLSTAHGVPEVYMTVANVSRVLQDSDTNVYTSAVRPRLKDRNRVYGCNQFINVAHKLDPFTMVRTFAPTWKKGSARPLDNLKFDSYQQLSISGLTGSNPHDLEHYLAHPGAHVPLFRNLVSKGAVKDAEFKKQLEAHKQATVGGQFNTVKAAVENMQLSDESSLSSAIKAWTDYQLMIKSLTQQT